MKRQIVLNILSNYLSRGVVLALGIFVVPFLVWKLGVEAFGIIVLAESLSRFIDLVSGSIRMALARHATFAYAQGNLDEFTDYLSTGRVILSLAAVIVLVLGCAFGFFVPHMFKVPADYASDSRNLFIFFTVAFTITFPNMVFWASLFAKQRYDLLNSATAAGLILRAVLIFILFSVLPPRFVNLTTYGFIYLAVTWLDNLIVFIWSRRLFPDIRIRFSRFKIQKVKDIFWFSAFTTITHSSGVLYDNLIQTLINILWGPRYNAIYGIAEKFPSAMKRLFVEPTWTLTPTFTELVAKNDGYRLKLLFSMYSKAVVIVSLPIVVFLAAMSGPIIDAWVGPDFSLAAVMMSISLAPLLLTMPMSVAGCVYNAYAKVKVPSIISVVSLAAELGLGMVLALTFSMGLVGIAAAEAIGAVVVALVFTASYACRVSGYPLKEFWMSTYLPPFLWGCLMAGGGMTLYHLAFGNVLVFSPAIAVLFAAWAFAYIFGAYQFVLEAAEKIQVRAFVRLLFEKLGQPVSGPPENDLL